MARNLLCACWVILAVTFSLATRAAAAVPSEQLLPDTTVGFLAAPDVDALRAKWNQIQLGQLFDDPVMKPFVEDLNKQLKSKLSKTGIKLGITWEDLDGVYGGEVCLAAVQPEHKPTLHGMVLLMDVTGKQAQVDVLLKKVVASQTAKGSKIATKKIGGQNVTTFAIKKREGVLPDNAYYVVLKDYLVATDHEGTIAFIINELQKPGGKTLAGLKSFQVSTAEVAKNAGDLKPHLRWYINPFAYAEVARAMAGGKKKRGTDILKVLRNQGFAAVQGASGYITLGDGEHEILHRSFVYAPRDAKAAEGEKYRLGARMLNFPNKPVLAPPAWVPGNVATFASLNWKMQDAFGKYLASVVNEFADSEVFEEVLESIKADPAGPKVDLRKGLIEQLGERAMLITDCIEPIDTRSERLMVAVEVLDAAVVAATIEKAMKVDPDAHERKHNGHVIWEIRNEEKVVMVDEVMIDGPGAVVEEKVAVPGDEAAGEPKLPNSAVTVAHGHLIIASHVDFIIKALDGPAAALDAGEDHQRVTLALNKLGGGADALRHFVRTDKAYHATYELVKQGKMPQAETVLGRVLNHLAADEDEDEPVVRTQQIDGTKMPDYDAVRKYLGPAGIFMQSQDEGWLVTGCLLKK